MVSIKKLEHFIDIGFNVLLEGTHGLGKTAIIKKAFENKGLKWKYFSAATMDPWIDFIGVPKTITGSSGEDELVLVKPREFANDEVEALFFDEFNRAPDKVINAVMELIQFRSINGKKFDNLKVVWVAINPYDEDGTYSVSKIDAAVRDRFHVQIKVPLELDVGYLTSTFGDIARPFIKWWNELPTELKMEISPRRVDYAIQAHLASCDLSDILPAHSNIKKLIQYIQSAKKNEDLSDILGKSAAEIKAFFNLERTIRYAEEILQTTKFAPLAYYFPQDFVESHIQNNSNDRMHRLILQFALKNPEFEKKLSTHSKAVITKVRNSKGIITQAHVDYALENAIRESAQQGVGKTTQHLIKKLEPVFETYLLNLKKQKSTDITSFFTILFDLKDKNNQKLGPALLDSLCNAKNPTPFRNLDPSQQIFAGFFLNFAFKYSQAEKTQHATQIKGLIDEMAAIKNTSKGRQDSRFVFVFMAFLEKNWPDLKDYLQKNGSLSKAARSTALNKIARALLAKPSTELSYKEPGSLSKAHDIFSKEKLK